MKKVDNDVQTYTDSFMYVWNAILSFWASVPIELKMYLAVMLVTSIAIRYYKFWKLPKNIVRSKTERLRKMRLMALPLSCVLAAAAWPIYEDKIHYGWFIFTGITAWQFVMWIHFLWFKLVWPFLRDIKKYKLQKVEPDE